MTEVMTAEQKYSSDGPFKEPVLICDSCTKLVLLEDILHFGACIHCGNTRVRSVKFLNLEQRKQVEKWIIEGKVDSDWMNLFEEKGDN